MGISPYLVDFIGAVCAFRKGDSKGLHILVRRFVFARAARVGRVYLVVFWVLFPWLFAPRPVQIAELICIRPYWTHIYRRKTKCNLELAGQI